MKRILLVDNDTDFVDACRNLLESAGYQVAGESNEGSVVAKVLEFKPDLILLDVVMEKETSGFELAEKISQDSQASKVPVVFLTGFFKKAALTEDDKKMINRWPNVKGLLDKPVKPAVLLGAINKIIK